MFAIESVARDALRFNVLLNRARKRISQVALAEAAGVSRSIISAIENGEGNPTLETLAQIAGVLEVDVFSLFAMHEDDGSDGAIANRSKKREEFVDAADVFAALDDRAERYSTRGRRKALSS